MSSERTPAIVWFRQDLRLAGIASDDLGSWALLPTKPDWAGGLGAAWTPGEVGAAARLAGYEEVKKAAR